MELSKEVAYAAAMRICRFTTANEFSDWLTVLHTFTYGNAVHQTLKRVSSYEGVPSAELVRGLFHGALRVISTVSSTSHLVRCPESEATSKTSPRRDRNCYNNSCSPWIDRRRSMRRAALWPGTSRFGIPPVR